MLKEDEETSLYILGKMPCYNAFEIFLLWGAYSATQIFIASWTSNSFMVCKNLYEVFFIGGWLYWKCALGQF